jgi:hypothetical protein
LNRTLPGMFLHLCLLAQSNKNRINKYLLIYIC